MPSMADITVKASNGTTDVVFVASSPSAGDKIPAVWRVNAASTVPQFRPKFSMLTRDNAARNARNFSITAEFPQTATINGVVTQVAKVPFSFTGTLPTNVDAAGVKEAIYQFGNLLVATLTRQALEAGYSPQ